jgi:hypothetical protein
MPDTKKKPQMFLREPFSQTVMKKNLKSNEMAKTLKRPLCGGSLW